jgi:predicted nucleic acid-binding protein
VTVDANTLLFFDASCLIAAAGSPNGGDGFLLALCRRGWLQAAVSHGVLLEAERNLAAKRPAYLARYHHLLAHTSWRLAPVPLGPAAGWVQQVNAKDRHVAVAALACGADYLLTLDRGLLAEVAQAGMILAALDPGTFIKTVLPQHRLLGGSA